LSLRWIKILIMKKIILFSLAFCLVAITTMAQKHSDSTHHFRGYNKMKFHGQHHMDLSKTLNFSDQQKQQLKSINQDFHHKMADLNKKEDITVKSMRDQKAALIKEQRMAFQNLLTLEQKNKLEDMKKESAIKKQEMASRRLDKMKTKLNLTEDQTAKIKALNDQFRENMKKFKENQTTDRSAKKEELMSAFKQHKEDFEKILTPEQLSKMQEWKKDKTGRF
jgi:Spy/CpxP family protein refolding chaperone